jgi:peptide alpha-N-acetyltransferase
MYPDNHPEAGPSRPRTPPTPSSADSTTLTPQFEATNIFDNPNNSNDGIAIAGPGGELETGPEMGGNQVMIDSKGDELYYRTYRGEKEDLWGVKRLIDQELSEPYVHLGFVLLRYSS